jgi:hypothetical protein
MSYFRKFIMLIMIISVLGIARSYAQITPENFEETNVRKYTLPDPLVMQNGAKVTDAADWTKNRRPEILELFKTNVFGNMPGKIADVSYKTLSSDSGALNGKATRKEVRVTFAKGNNNTYMDILMYVPNNLNAPAPAFIGLNFSGNHTVRNDPAITLSKQWITFNKPGKVIDHRATEASRGDSSGRWAIDHIIDSGYALATIYCGDIDPDWDDGFQNGIHPFFLADGQMTPSKGEWGTIGAWSWGLSRALDYLETDTTVDASKVAVMGHSRLGKAALWAGANDERFALVISNNSGCGGASLYRRNFGETIAMINTNFPHWFNNNFNMYNNNEDALPVDSHMLLALMAPRPVYVASAAEDLHADPRGEFMAAFHASPVYELFGKTGLPAQRMPAVDTPVMGTVGYHCRTGGHNVTEYDWRQYVRFADMHLK